MAATEKEDAEGGGAAGVERPFLCDYCEERFLRKVCSVSTREEENREAMDEARG